MLLISQAIAAQTKDPSPGTTPQTQYPTEFHLQIHTSPAHAAEVLSSIGGLLNFSSEHSGLPIRTQVQGHLIDREAVRQKMFAELRKEDVALRLDRSSLVLQKLGLVPRNFDIRAFIVDLQNSQKDDSLAAFYDPSTKDFYMLNWVPAKEQSSVMAHELTHALQDQFVGLERWIKPLGGDDENTVEGKGRYETSVARRAAAEGQATAVMMDYLLAPSGRTLSDLPAIDESTLQKAMLSATNPAFLRAPRYIRESTVFPYTYGLRFVLDVLKQQGKARAFAGMLKNPPLNTHQVMHPAAYLAGEKVPAISLPSLESMLGNEYEKLDSGTVGEFDTLMFAEQFGSEEKAPHISSQWRGGYYYAARRKSGEIGSASGSPASEISPVATKTSGEQAAGKHSEPVALFYLSRWATPADAALFAQLYSSSVLQRYSDAELIPNSRKVGQAGARPSAWSSSEGLITVEEHGPFVLAIESFDEVSASKLRKIVTGGGSSAGSHLGAVQ